MIVDQETFCDEVEKLHAHKGLTMFESIFACCDKFNIDYELVGPLVNRSVREKLEEEAVSRRMMTSSTHSLF